MLRILRLTPHFYRHGRWPVAFDPIGGLQNQSWTIPKGMDQVGTTQTFLTSDIPGSPRSMQPSETMGLDLAIGDEPFKTRLGRTRSTMHELRP